MKKRLLSAALAMAMVLTLLPFSAVPAFAASAPTFSSEVDNGKTVTYYNAPAAATDVSDAHGIGWYHSYTENTGTKTVTHYVEVTSGVVNTYNGGTSGQWYFNPRRDFNSWNTTSFTLLGDVTIAFCNQPITADLNGHTLTIADTSGNYDGTNQISTDAAKCTSITVTDRLVSGNNADRGTLIFAAPPVITKSFKLNATNANVTITGGTDLKLDNTATSNSETLTVNLSNSVLNTSITTLNARGAIKLDTASKCGGIRLGDEANGKNSARNTSHSVQILGGSTANHVSMSGASAQLTMAGDSVKKAPSTTETTITVNSDSGAVIKLGETNAPVTLGGKFTLNAVSGGTVEAWNANMTAGGTEIHGYNTTLTARNSNLGAVTLLGLATADEKLQGQTAPKVYLYSGSTATSIGTVGAAAAENLKTPYTIVVDNNSNAGNITVYDANITLGNNGTNGRAGAVSLGQGSLTVQGIRSTVGAMTLGSTVAGGSVSLKVTGTGHDLGNLTVLQNNVKTLTLDVTLAQDSKIGTVNGNGYNYLGKGIKGPGTIGGWGIESADGTLSAGSGTDGTMIRGNWLADNLYYQVALAGGGYRYYQVGEIDQLISYYQHNKTATVTLRTQNPVTAGADKDNTITLLNGTDELLKLFYQGGKSTTVILPTTVSGSTVTSWAWSHKTGGAVDASGTHTSSEGFVLQTTDSGTYELNAKTTGRVVAGLKTAGSTNLNRGVTATVTGTTIKLTGAVSAGTTEIKFYVAAEGDDEGVYIPITVAYADGKVRFASTNTFPRVKVTQTGDTFTEDSTGLDPTGIRVESDTTIRLPNGTLYTVTSDLKVLAPDLYVGGNTSTSKAGVKTTSNVRTDTAYQKAQREAAMTNMDVAGGNGVVDFSASPAVLERFNAAVAAVNSSSFASWRTAAQRAAWDKAVKDGTETRKNPTATMYEETGYTQVWIVLYLDVQLSNYSSNGVPSAIEATLTPYYRIEVRQLGGDNKYTLATDNKSYIVQSAALGNLTGTMGTSKITIPVPGGDFAAAAANSGVYAHQDSTYVSDVTIVAGTAGTTAGSISFDLTHASTASGRGFGTIVVNRVEPQVTIYKNVKDNGDPIDPTKPTEGAKRGTYDNLQAAVNDAMNKDYVVVENGYGDTRVTVTGSARTFDIFAKGNTNVTCATSGVVQERETGSTGRLFTVQLLSNTTAEPTQKPVAITVATAANGTATSSAARADYGETVTITVRPNAGYGLSTLTIRTNTGANVAYQSTTTNVFTFKVPENVTSITVTPAFAVSSTATISVTDTVNGLATTNAANNKAAGGSTVTVTTRPFNGYRTSAVTAVTNTGAAVAVTRVAENTYTFVVPIAATSVVITPTFTAGGHPFTDVPDGQWYSDAVSFGYRHGMFTGYNGSTTRFAGTERLTRAELVVILYRLSGEPATTDNSGFSDVGSGIWYSKAITWATRNNIVRGGDNNRFYPLNNVTREELAQMLYNYNSYRRGSAGLTGNLSRFTDSNRVHSYHLTAMQWAVGNGIVQGNNNSQLNPGGTATRYEVATMLMRYGQSFMGLT